jgi:hypothetical protein
MQNRFVGDIGDYLKLSILRTLSPGYRLGVETKPTAAMVGRWAI